LFRPEEITRIFAEHRSKSRDHGNRIWRLLNLETWFRVMVENDLSEAAAICGNSSVGALT
jgi:hypothetical protein